jgi:ABC-3C protein
MDDLTRAWYGDKIELALRKKSEQEYEDQFNKIMQAIHGDDFVPIKAAGSEGDWKADGYLTTEKTVFQSYAPSSGMNKPKLLGKIDRDLPGAIIHWGKNIENWALIHNSWEGLPPYAVNQLEEYKVKFPQIGIEHWGPEIIKSKALSLPRSTLIDLFGPAPTMQDVHNLTHTPIKTLLKAIAKKDEAPEAEVLPVAVDKLEYNQLSTDIEALLRIGRTREALVQDLIDTWPDPQYGEDLAEVFRNRYKNLKAEDARPNEIFDQLKEFAGGNSFQSDHQVAALAVLSYFFSRCDIFENLPEHHHS